MVSLVGAAPNTFIGGNEFHFGIGTKCKQKGVDPPDIAMLGATWRLATWHHVLFLFLSKISKKAQGNKKGLAFARPFSINHRSRQIGYFLLELPCRPAASIRLSSSMEAHKGSILLHLARDDPSSNCRKVLGG